MHVRVSTVLIHTLLCVITEEKAMAADAKVASTGINRQRLKIAVDGVLFELMPKEMYVRLSFRIAPLHHLILYVRACGVVSH